MHPRSEASEREYLAVESIRQSTRLARSQIRRVIRRRPERVPSVVRANYDGQREGRAVVDFDYHVFGDPHEEKHVVIDDRVVCSNVARVKQHVRASVAAAVRDYTAGVSDPTVIEFGCGGGRNLLYLKKTMPELRCRGIDISPASIDLAQRAAERFELDIEFGIADVTAGATQIGHADVCLSVHALEQMPRLFRSAVDTMLASSRRATLFFEPVGELYPSSLRGYLGRMRLREHDYLDGLYLYLRDIGAPIVRAQRLRQSPNPLNETVEIRVDHRSTPTPA